MPIRFETNPDRELTTLTLTGQLTLDEMIEGLQEYGESGPTRLELYDARGLEGERISTEEVDKLVAYFQKFPDVRGARSRTAVLVNTNLDFGLTRMVALLTESRVSFEVNVFKTMEDAKAWLFAD